MDTVKRVTVGQLTPQALLDRLLQPDQHARTLGEAICNVYWGGGDIFDLRRLEELSEQDWTLFANVARYRRHPFWSEAQFHAVACWCRAHFSLTQWAHDD